MNAGRGHVRTHRYGSGAGNHRADWRARPSPNPYRAAAVRALSTAWAVLAGNAGRGRYPRRRQAPAVGDGSGHKPAVPT